MPVVGGSLDQMLGQQSLSNLLGQDKMTPALFRPPAAKPTRLEQAQETLTGVEQRLGETQKQIGEFEAQKQAFQAEQEAKRAAKGAELAGKERAEIEASPVVQESQRIALEAAQARFEPSQRNATENAALFSLIGAIGFAIGAGGKKNAMQAMAAMNGMVEGVRKGDIERYTREKSTFETNLNALYRSSQLLATEAKRAVDLASRNKEQARLDFESVLAQEGADFVKQYYQKFGLVGTQKLLEQQAKGAQRMVENAQKAEATEKERIRAEEARAAQQREAAQQRASLAFALKGMTQAKPIVVQGADGKMYQIDPSKLPMAPEGVAVTPFAKSSSGGAANARYAFNINESFSQAAVDLLNVSQMPANTMLGTFAGMTGQTGDTILKSLANTFARKVTPEDSRLMQQIVAGLDQNMGRALGGGYATSTSKGLIQAYKEQVAQFGDSPLAQAMFLSRMKQELGVLAKAFKNHPGANEGYVNDMKDYMTALEEAIPFTVKDVIAANRGQKQTVTDKFANLAQSPVKLRLPSSGAPVGEGVEETATPSAPAVKKEKARPGEVVHQDQKGNRAVKRDGQWVEVE